MTVTFPSGLVILPGLFPKAARSIKLARFWRASPREEQMKKLISTVMSLLLVAAVGLTAFAVQNSTSSTGTTASKKRGPVFRASKEQIKQAQAIVKERGFYAGDPTGKLDDDTRAGLKKYQAAESLKVTGTLNKITLEKMGIPLTEKQKVM